MNDKIDPRKVFYMVYPRRAADAQGLDLDDVLFASEGAGIAWAESDIAESGGEFIICECTPLKRVYQPKTAIEPIEGATKQRKPRTRRKPDAPAKAEEGKGVVSQAEIEAAAQSDGTISPAELAAMQGIQGASDELPDFLRRHSPESVTEAEAG